MSTFLDLAQTLQMAIKALQMYTSAHPRSQDALKTLAGALAEWLLESPELQMTASAGKLFVNGTPVEGSSLHLSALIRQFSERQIAGFVIRRGASAEELLGMLEILILKPARLEELGGVARVLAGKDLRHISLSQTQYREVREGEGGEADHGGSGPGMDSGGGNAPQEIPREGASEPLAIDIAEALDLWRQHLAASVEGAVASAPGDSLGSIPAADLGGLGQTAGEAGWGAGFPTAPQMESLRQALQGLPAEGKLSILKGMGSLPAAPAGLHMGFQALAPEIVAQASTELVSRGLAWPDLKDVLYGIIDPSPQRQTIASGLEAAVRNQGLSAGQFSDLLRQLDWDNQSVDEKIRRAIEDRRIWDLSLEQRLDFLRELLKKGRTEPFLRLLEVILGTLTHDDPRPREAAAHTLAGITHWIGEPGFPAEAEGPILDGLKGHFGWEPVPHIHRSTEEGLEAMLQCFLTRGEISHAQGLVQELRDLLAFLEDNQEWRRQSIDRLVRYLSSPEPFSKAVEALHNAEPDTVRSVVVPYFEFLGEAGAGELVRILGEEPDRKRRGRLLDLIRALGPLALSALNNSLKSPTWYLVRNTLNLLADMGNAGMLGEVTPCLQHADGRVRRAAVRAAWKLGGSACAPHLLPMFPVADPETQVEILFGLGQVRSGMAVFVLADFAKNPGANERVRIKTIETLGQIGNPSAIPSLADLIRRKGRIFSLAESTEVRLAAARALLAIGTPQAVDALRNLISEEPRNKDRHALQQILDAPGRPQGIP